MAASEEYNYALSQKSIKPWSSSNRADGDGEYDEYREEDDDDDDEEDDDDDDDEEEENDEEEEDNYDYDDGDEDTEMITDRRHGRAASKKTKSGKKCDCSANISRVSELIYFDFFFLLKIFK